MLKLKQRKNERSLKVNTNSHHQICTFTWNEKRYQFVTNWRDGSAGWNGWICYLTRNESQTMNYKCCDVCITRSEYITLIVVLGRTTTRSGLTKILLPPVRNFASHYWNWNQRLNVFNAHEKWILICLKGLFSHFQSIISCEIRKEM